MPRPGRWPSAAALLAVAVKVLGAQGLYLEGELPSRADFAEYVGKFCYDFTESRDSSAGQLRTEVYWDAPLGAAVQSAKLYVMLFDDEKKRWAVARQGWDTSSCEAKRDMASYVIDIDLSSESSRFVFSTWIAEHIRPRFWYITFVACDVPPSAKFRYTLHATNDLWGWQREFSFHRVGLLPAISVLMGAFALATAVTIGAVRRQSIAHKQRWDKHPYIRLLLVLCIASSASCACLLGHYIAFAKDGRGSKGLLFAGILAVTVANCTMFLIAALSSIGWTISGTATRCPCRWRIFSAVLALGVASAVCEFHSEITFDESSRLFAHESMSGMLVMVLKAVLFAWVLCQMRHTYKDEWQERQRSFYWAFSIGFACWAVSAPVNAIVAYNLSPWWRFKVVTILELIARLTGVMLLARLFSGPLSPILREKRWPGEGEVDPSTLGMQVLVESDLS